MTDLLNASYERRETHPTPEWVERVCAEFGITESGVPKYRVIFNPDRTRMCFGREIRKYPRLGERWILETLLPWELYGVWSEEAFGPKPADGEYCHTHTFQQTHEGDFQAVFQQGYEQRFEFLSLDDFGQDNLRLLIQCIENGKAVQAWQVRNHDLELLDLIEKLAHEDFEDAFENSRDELEKLEQLQEKTGLLTSLDPLPKPIAKERRAKGRQSGKHLIH